MKKETKKNENQIEKSQQPSSGVKRSLRRCERGLSTVEYIIILVLIAAAGVGLWTQFGTALTEKLGKVNTTMESVK